MTDSKLSWMLSSKAALLVSFVAVLLYGLYRKAMPKPIPGIPYNTNSAKSVLGDMPAMIEQVNATGRIFPWVVSQTAKLQSPIIQLFIRPFQKPWVILTDYREAQDIMMRRTKEFDHSEYLIEVFKGMTPEFHIAMASDDERFKENRQLIRDLMSPSFLNQVAAPQVYANVETLLSLWKLKMRLANGRPFSALEDVYNGTLDFIFAAAFGLDTNDSVTISQLRQLLDNKMNERQDSTGIDEPIQFIHAPLPPHFEAIITLTESLGITVQSPVPRLHHWIMRQLPYMRRALALKEKLITTELQKGIKRLESGDLAKRSALDDILQRELIAAEKEGRAPSYSSRAIYDELFGFLVAGHDTTSSTMTWGIKRLSSNQLPQATLRSCLRKAFTRAVAEHRNPTVDEITKTSVPYLDATIEEIVRTALTFPCVIRMATVDTAVLGHHIPKGTNVFLMQNGPDFRSAPFTIAESDRSESSQNAKQQVGSWNVDDMTEFKPERWLLDVGTPQESFNASAGPHLAFGLGPRSCFGRRLGYLNMRIIVVLLIWNFEFQTCPEALSTYAGTEKMSLQPNQCYVRLAPAEF